MLCAVMTMLLLAASAADAASLSKTQQQRLDQLDAKRYAKRERATQALMAGPHLDNATLKAMLEAADSAEQRHRLRTIARHQTLRPAARQQYGGDENNPGAGSIGIRHYARPKSRQSDAPAAVIVVDTICGFPGRAHLQPGDAIVAINGQAVPDDVDRNYVTHRTTQFRAGDTMRFTVLRRGERQRVSLELASGAALEASFPEAGAQPVPHMSEAFLKPWRQRLQALPFDDEAKKTIAVE
jgi:C-terminal processing protease CtpA/Prc